MSYTAKDYSALVGLPGFSETLLKNHFTLYQGYVANTNKVLDTLDAMLKDGRAGTPEYAELKRRLGWEFDGMRLHEFYFENLGAAPLAQDGALAKRLAADFGSYENWEKDFKATGAMRGIGWTILYQDPVNGAPGRVHAAADHGRLRARLHDRLRPQARRLHRRVLRQHQLGRGRSALEVGRASSPSGSRTGTTQAWFQRALYDRPRRIAGSSLMSLIRTQS
jgi:superoxide dismutase